MSKFSFCEDSQYMLTGFDYITNTIYMLIESHGSLCVFTARI